MYARHRARTISFFWICAVAVLLGGFVLLFHMSGELNLSVWCMYLSICGVNCMVTLFAYSLFCAFTSKSYHTFDGFFYRRYRRGVEQLCIRWEAVYAVEYTRAAWLFLGDASGGELIIRYRKEDVDQIESVSVSLKELRRVKEVCPRYLGMYP